MTRQFVPVHQLGRKQGQSPVAVDPVNLLLVHLRDPGGHHALDPDLGQLIVTATLRVYLVFTEAHVRHDHHRRQ